MRDFLPLSPPSSAGRRVGVLLLVALGWSDLHAQVQVDPAILLGPPNCGAETQPGWPEITEITYAAKPGDTVNTQIPVKDGRVDPKPPMGYPLYPNDVFWSLGTAAGCTGGLQSIQCGPDGMDLDHVFKVDAPAGQVSPATSLGWVQISRAPLPDGKPRTIKDTDIGRKGSFKVTVSEAPGGDPTCTWNYLLHVTGTGGGWGDPHITTVDGVHYDFQSAGEFTALREDRFEVQTRQTPVPTTTIPGTNEYTGLQVCVSIYTAVAARIGSNRVTFQPNLKEPSLLGQADPSGMQLRVNGQLVTLTDSGINLMGGGGPGGSCIVEGRIVPAGGGAIEITDARGTQLVITPAFWESQQKWYLNVNVYQTSATQGTMGLTTAGWLPALPDGTSLGPRPEAAQQRYQQLYETFADAWRVTNATSLFDYAPGTNTGTFTLDEWPRFNPQSCDLEGQTPVQPTTQQAAEQACSGVTDAAQKADCIFDVTVTGETGFAQSYEAMQRFRPHGTGWQPPLADAGQPTTTPGAGASRHAWSLHAGLTDPTSGFASEIDGDLLVEADLEVALSRRFSLNAVLGHYSFDPDPAIFGGTLYARGYFPGESFRFFSEVGAGLYDPDNLDLSWGLSGGLGVDWALPGTWRAELGADFFHLFNDGDDLEFLAYKIGVRRGF